ncbi:MAG: riboflavin synthase [Deltaproteobacteria bacterium]|nr:riboflavin synthase [Deltaproteobacteria bacterium]
MFTGIIEAIGRVKSVEKKGASGRITIEALVDLARENVRPLSGVNLGDSISVNGACLTVTEIKKCVEGGHPLFSADMSAETLKLTTLGTLKSGAHVNLEAALTLSKPLGGHIVTGHVDGIGTIRKKSANGRHVDLEISVPERLMSQIVKKGSIAVDGISLTVTEVGLSPLRGLDFFKTAIIPHTLEKTTLPSKAEGSTVNIETDVLAKYVERFLSAKEGKKGVSEEFLKEHGFFKKG